MAGKTNESEHEVKTIDERRKTTHEAVVDDVLAIAREMMQADGVAAVSFNGVARRLGIKPPSLYTYFDSKSAIYDTLFRKGYEQFVEHIRAKVVRDQGLEAFLHSFIVAYMSFGLENPDLFQLMFQRPIPGFVPSDGSLEVSFGALQEMRQTLQGILEQEAINIAQPIEQTGDLIISLVYGMTALQLANEPDTGVGEGRFGSLTDNAVELVMQALKR